MKHGRVPFEKFNARSKIRLGDGEDPESYIEIGEEVTLTPLPNGYCNMSHVDTPSVIWKAGCVEGVHYTLDHMPNRRL